MILGEKIYQLRKAKNLSQDALASQIDVTRQSISKWELSESVPDTENIIQLSRILGVSTDYLLFDEYEPGIPTVKEDSIEAIEGTVSHIAVNEAKSKARKKHWLTTDRLKINILLMKVAFFAALALISLFAISWLNAMIFQDYRGLNKLQLVSQQNLLEWPLRDPEISQQRSEEWIAPGFPAIIAEGHDTSPLAVFGSFFLSLFLLCIPIALLCAVGYELLRFLFIKKGFVNKKGFVKRKGHTNDIFGAIALGSSTGLLFTILFMICMSHIGETLETPVEITFGVYDYVTIIIYSLLTAIGICGLPPVRKAIEAFKHDIHPTHTNHTLESNESAHKSEEEIVYDTAKGV